MSNLMSMILICMISPGGEGVQQRGLVLEEVFLLDGVFQTQQLTWDQRHFFHLPFSLKKRVKELNLKTC